MYDLIMLFYNDIMMFIVIFPFFFIIGFLATLSDRWVYNCWPNVEDYPVFVDKIKIKDLSNRELNDLLNQVNELIEGEYLIGA